MIKWVEGCGFACIDYIKTDKSILCDIGGTCANVLSFLSFLGWESHIWMPEYAENYLSDWLKDRGVCIEYFTKTKKSVPVVIQVPDRIKKTHRFLTRCPECGSRLAEICLPTRKHMQVSSKIPGLFFCDRISEGIVHHALEVAEAGGITMYEPNGLRTYNQLLANCRKFHIVKFSEEKIPAQWQQNLLNDVKKENVKLIIVTKGKKGLKFATAKKWMWTEVNGVSHMDEQDSSGAGDWLTAVFLNCYISQISNENDIFDHDIVYTGLQSAMKAAELSCKEVGAHGILHSRKRISELEDIIGASLSDQILARKIYGNVICPYCHRQIL